MKVGVNCYGLRKAFFNDFAGSLSKLKEMGVASLEICVEFPSEPVKEDRTKEETVDNKVAAAAIWPYEEALEKIADIREKGIEVFAAHVMAFVKEPADLLKLVPYIKEMTEKTGIKYFVYSPFKLPRDLIAYIPVFNQLCDELEVFGAKFLLHNHESECQMEGEKTGLEMILEQCPGLGLELDVGWVKFAGRDSLALMDRIGDRMKLVHLKDIREDASAETRNTCFTAIGEGSIPLNKIIRKAFALGLGEGDFIIDQDDSAGDMLDDIERGVQNIQEVVSHEDEHDDFYGRD